MCLRGGDIVRLVDMDTCGAVSCERSGSGEMRKETCAMPFRLGVDELPQTHVSGIADHRQAVEKILHRKLGFPLDMKDPVASALHDVQNFACDCSKLLVGPSVQSSLASVSSREG